MVFRSAAPSTTDELCCIAEDARLVPITGLSVLRGVAFGGAVPGGGGGGFWRERSRMSAPGTELCCWRQRSAALGAGTPERRCAFLAELRALLIFVTAFRALHQRPQA